MLDLANTWQKPQDFAGTDHPGWRLQNLTSTQRDALTGFGKAKTGHFIFNTTTSRPNFYDGSSWLDPAASDAVILGADSSDTQVLFNDGTTIAGDAGLTYNKTTNFLTVTSGGITLTTSTINKLTLTPPATAATLAIIDGTTITGPSATTTLPGLSLANIWTANGALSSGAGPAATFNGTWITGGSATTTKPYVLVEPTGTTSTGWSTSGTGVGINAASGFAGNLADFQVAGVSKIKILSDGSITSSSNGGYVTFNVPINIAGTSTIQGLIYFSTPGNGLLLLQDQTASAFAGRLQFGGTTSSFPSLARSNTVLQARLADGSAFAPLQGALRTAANATTGLTAGVLAALTNASIVITDASGQDYRVPCII